MGDRRFDARLALTENVELQWRGALGPDVRSSGLMLDLSMSGARIRLDRPVAMKTAVTVIVKGREIPATVRYCIRAKTAFIAGVEFQPEYQGILRLNWRQSQPRLAVRA
jgi:hypothetical protein